MTFRDRADGGRRLARALGDLTGEDVVVLGLPRGGVPVAAEVARALGAPLDVIVVRKLGVPWQPEYAMGAIGEGGVRVVDPDVVRQARVEPEQLAQVEATERAELERRAARYRGHRPRVPLEGRTAIVVDDGIATGSTARAACAVARRLGARRIVLATPVAPARTAEALRDVADEVVVVETPRMFAAVGEWYDDFGQTRDDEVVALLAAAAPEAVGAAERDVVVTAAGARLPGVLVVPEGAREVVAFAHGSGSSRNSPRNRWVAGLLNDAGLGTLLFDLLTPAESANRANVFDVDLLGARLAGATRWLRSQPGTRDLDVAYFGASTGAAAALWAAAEPGNDVTAVVSRGGRPDLAGPRLGRVRAPTLLVVGGEDHLVLDLNRRAAAELHCESRVAVVPGATHLFEEPGTLRAAAELARDWFVAALSPGRVGSDV